jgi:CDP-4-dehydro-6-deoxyglucose reductase
VVLSKERRGEVFVLKLQLSGRTRIRPAPGQYIEIESGRGACRAYSVANIPQCDGCLELHVKRREGGQFSHRHCEVLNPGDVLWIHGPYGDFTLRPESARPVLFVATGTGFSPVKAMLASGLLARSRTVRVYWGGRVRADWYFADMIEDLASRYDDFQFRPVLSRPSGNDGWFGRAGHVQKWVESEIGDLRDYEVYACGSPQMVRDAFEVFTTRCALPAAHYRADAFYSGG